MGGGLIVVFGDGGESVGGAGSGSAAGGARKSFLSSTKTEERHAPDRSCSSC